MDKLEVFGARKLKGNVYISGSKNAALPILAASILSNKNNPLVEIRFADCFPVSLSGLDYTQQVADVEYLTASVDFRYKLYEIVTL